MRIPLASPRNARGRGTLCQVCAGTQGRTPAAVARSAAARPAPGRHRDHEAQGVAVAVCTAASARHGSRRARQSPTMPCAARCSNSARPASRGPCTRSGAGSRGSCGAPGEDVQHVAELALDELRQPAGRSRDFAQASQPARGGRSPAIRAAAPRREWAALDSCQPRRRWARNCGPMWKVWLIVPPPAGGGARRQRTALVHEAAGHGAGAAADVLEVAPDGEVGVVAVQVHRHVADGVARSKPTTQPLRWASSVMARRSSTWPVRCTPGSSTRAMRGPCVSSARAIASKDKVPPGSSGASSISASAGSKPWKRICDSTA